MKWVKTLVLIIVTIASASVLVVAVSAALSMAALCLIALLTAYIVSPEDVKAIYATLTGKIDGWLKTLSDMTRAMAGAIHEAATFAKEASQGSTEPQEAAQEAEAPEQKARPNASESSKATGKPRKSNRPS